MFECLFISVLGNAHVLLIISKKFNSKTVDISWFFDFWRLKVLKAYLECDWSKRNANEGS